MLYQLNANKTKAIMPLNDLANICGHFFNAWLNDKCHTCPNNGYNCNHPDCDEITDNIGCCHTWSCPLCYKAEESDYNEFQWNYNADNDDYVIVTDTRTLNIIKNKPSGT